jgi:hypothetical protein
MLVGNKQVAYIEIFKNAPDIAYLHLRDGFSPIFCPGLERLELEASQYLKVQGIKTVYVPNSQREWLDITEWTENPKAKE